ncbi:alpha/beta fold hydrolase [Luteolibacter yonseiensis]|uniref:Alpha/beta fold hydrolase n=1 Tax=Luteolibacter yonseiensis TaxID=1144680 RepID=A0A934R740_9BACT|nr:alpha/beta fold hydrolase [Luteolibacter yonseiensis]MBK1817426.1 alpha/beta fold hydrolase [Luteolibacter yonseiensis]
MKPKIIFIHGMFLTPKSWEKWVGYFENLGYECHAPAWPMHEQEPALLRENIPADLGSLGLATLYRHHAALLEKQLTPPVVIGHSMGGLLMQKLAAAGLIRAGVGICSVAPNRMLAADWGFLRNSASITNPFAGDEPYEMTPELFHQNFGNTMTEEDSNSAYRDFAVHESRQVLRNIMGEDGQVDVDQPHVPLLFLGALEDEIIPNTLVARNAHAYTDERSHSEYFGFSGRGHFICGQNGWEEVALHIANWLESHLAATRS